METRVESSWIRRVRTRTWCALVAAAVCVAAGARVRGDTHEALDLTDDLYHRIKAGLFVPACEPLVLRVTRAGTAREGDPAPGEYLTFARDSGSFAVKTDARGNVVVHMDLEAALSHIRVITLPERGLVREFDESPHHPIR